MNYYPHHVGDYMTATAHLTWLEDCAYRRLLDSYYVREQPFPVDIAQVCRLVRAAGKDERKAVETVLAEFFVLGANGWQHGRCEREIEKAKVGIASKIAFWRSIPAPVRAAMQARRRAAKLRATPPWLTKSDNDQIKAVYLAAAELTKNTGIPHDVDHIVPLQGKTVCGLHVAWNLRPIPASANRAKGSSLQ